MQKFDPSCGIKANEIRAIKYNVKNNILMELPTLPDHIETRLFLQGRDPWIFYWVLSNSIKLPVDPKETLSIEVIVKLKKDFHGLIEQNQYRFTCKVERQSNIHHPRISVDQKA